MEEKNIYIVEADTALYGYDAGKQWTLGYATGNPEDILDHYRARREAEIMNWNIDYYHINLRPLTIDDITEERGKEAKGIIARILGKGGC